MRTKSPQKHEKHTKKANPYKKTQIKHAKWVKNIYKPKKVRTIVKQKLHRHHPPCPLLFASLSMHYILWFCVYCHIAQEKNLFLRDRTINSHFVTNAAKSVSIWGNRCQLKSEKKY